MCKQTSSIDKLTGTESYRPEQKREGKQDFLACCDTSHETFTQCHATEIDIELEKEIEWLSKPKL